ncbi:hypothetical protein E4U59_001742 [Claviceps monticola]|nr:hypothetical protein E4U59_001742 [Claviceps monticola]
MAVLPSDALTPEVIYSSKDALHKAIKFLAMFGLQGVSRQNIPLLKGRGTELEDCNKLTQCWDRKIRPMLSLRHSMTSRSLPARRLRACVATAAAAAPNSVYSAMPRVVASHEQPIFHIKFATRDPQTGTMGIISVGITNDQGMQESPALVQLASTPPLSSRDMHDAAINRATLH